MKIYIDQGVNQKIIKRLRKKHELSIINGHSNEQRILNSEEVSQPFRLDHSLLDRDFLAGDEIFDVERIVGKRNVNDIDHLYTAFVAKCEYFITDNPRDFIRRRRNDPNSNEKREELESILKGIKIATIEEFIIAITEEQGL